MKCQFVRRYRRHVSVAIFFFLRWRFVWIRNEAMGFFFGARAKVHVIGRSWRGFSVDVICWMIHFLCLIDGREIIDVIMLLFRSLQECSESLWFWVFHKPHSYLVYLVLPKITENNLEQTKVTRVCWRANDKIASNFSKKDIAYRKQCKKSNTIQ